jgi:PDZ domain/Peptidase family S41
LTRRLFSLACALFGLTAATGPRAEDYAADARALAPLIAANYAYLDYLPGESVPHSARLDVERDAVHDQPSLLRYAEDLLTTLADHHASTAKSFKDDWALVPSYSDLWIEHVGTVYKITAVRTGSLAEAAGLRAGDRLIAVDGQPTDRAVAGFWQRLGLPSTGERAPYAARILAAGRRDRPRSLTVGNGRATRTIVLANLYSEQAQRPPVSVDGSTIRINNSLGDRATIAAFDQALAAIPRRAPIVIDLTDTPSGGTTSVARAIMSWFVRKPTAYQVHNSPVEERETGIGRQWIEQVLPRAGKFHGGPVTIRVGRWTGSMGEGLAAGFAAIGARVCGAQMAGLKGAVRDFDLPRTGLRVKFPAERLYTVAGLPREQISPAPCGKAYGRRNQQRARSQS